MSTSMRLAMHSMSLEGLAAAVYEVAPTTQAVTDRSAVIEDAERNALEKVRGALEAFVVAR
jgi:uncharacterized membrane protein YgcG